MIKFKKVFQIKNIFKVLWILFVVFSMIYWVPSVDNMLVQNYSEISEYVAIDNNWNVTVNNKSYKNISLDDFSLKEIKKDDKIIMQRVLPKDWKNIVQGTLRLHIRQTAVKIYIDDDLIYEYGSDRVNENKTVGSGFQFIKFLDQYKGKPIKIELSVTEDNAFSKFDSIRIYEFDNAYRILLTENRLPMFLGSFLTIFGLSTLIITAFGVIMSRKYIRIFCISAFSICVGLWTLSYYNVLLIFAIPLYSISLMEYMALYLAPLPLLIYMYENVKDLKNKTLKSIYWVLLSVQVLFDMLILTLHTMDIVHCASVLQYFQILIICHLIYFTIVLIIKLKKSKKINRFYIVGMLVISVCIGYDLVDYYCNRYIGNSELTLKGVSSIGVMVFIFILLYTFYMNLTEKMMQETERKSLIKSAYTDELTQLSNRRYCSEYMEKIKNEKILKYAVICFDLNNLKTVNDTYGHAKGDVLIKSAADVISETFKEYGIVGRMGGDEFIAILTDFDEKAMKSLMDNFITNIKVKNQKIPDLNLSIAYGYALSDEKEEKDIEKIYQKADDRMYKNKKQYKEHIMQTKQSK